MLPQPINAAPPSDGLPPAKLRAAMVAVLMAVSMSTFDIAIVNTALPTMARDLGTSAASSIWIVSAYQLAIVASLLPFAALGEIVGHRRVYISGLIVFTAASLLCGLSTSLPMLAAARVIQGLGGSAVVSVNLAMIRFIFPARQLGKGVGLNALVVGASFTAGPSLASLILSFASWHWLFLINLPFGGAAIWLSLRNLPMNALASHRFDALAAILTGLVFVLLVLGIDAAGHDGSIWLTLAEWAGAAISLMLLLYRQSGHPAPMLALDLFRIPVFALSALTSFCAFTAQGLAFVALPFLFQSVLGRGQVEAGLLLTPWPAIVASLAPVSGRMADRYSTGLLGFIGLACLGIGLSLLATLPASPSNYDIMWRLLVCGGGFGLFQSPNLKALMGSAPARRSGGASGIVSTARILGQATGAALVAVCFHLDATGGPVLALWLGCGFAAAAAIVSLLRITTGAVT
jgi:DHA2 family multidrug resistance protein-like MFS transporter